MEESINRPIPNGYRRIFLSTNIAETSLTFPYARPRPRPRPHPRPHPHLVAP